MREWNTIKFSKEKKKRALYACWTLEQCFFHINAMTVETHTYTVHTHTRRHCMRMSVSEAMHSGEQNNCR